MGVVGELPHVLNLSTTWRF